MNGPQKAIGKKIRALRRSRGMTGWDLAGKVGLSQAQISRLEDGKQGLRWGTLSRIARALGVKPVYFYLDDERGSAVYGLEAGEDLREALRKPAFRDLLKEVAHEFKKDPEAFEAIEKAVRVIMKRKGGL